MDPVKWWTTELLRLAAIRLRAQKRGDRAAYAILSGRMGTYLALIEGRA